MSDCDTIRDLIDDWLDGRLDTNAAAVVAAHVAACDECRFDAEAARAIRPAAQGLPRAILPTRDLWVGIRGRLRPRRRLAVSPWALVAAALILTAASSLVTTALLRSASGPAAASLPMGFAAAEARALEATARLTAAYQQSRPTLAAATREVIERNLAVIDRAPAETRRALENDPANSTLGNRARNGAI